MNFSWPLEKGLFLLFVWSCLRALHNGQTVEYNIWARNAVNLKMEEELYLFKRPKRWAEAGYQLRPSEREGSGCARFGVRRALPHAVPAPAPCPLSRLPARRPVNAALSLSPAAAAFGGLRGAGGGVLLPGNGRAGISRRRQGRDTSAPASQRASLWPDFSRSIVAANTKACTAGGVAAPALNHLAAPQLLPHRALPNSCGCRCYGTQT
ncbi:PREDICTED: uncharacterized protein LOC102011150 isoform X2 [Chinchilla lanigera]|uniref:uncharacterized protein LOC102011150 isoform X2 n=1 Tax=Chinchilla lanigera TaxID=34839 RepID=UPI00038F08A1|nr:PREDICTED: uncharacterized protein LOC102011150 isoform X2 [Chinchilla lanigera]